eukprot:566950-Hanusia_phi.AAC.1
MIGLELSQQSERRTPGTVRPATGPPRPRFPAGPEPGRQVLDGASPETQSLGVSGPSSTRPGQSRGPCK